MDDEKQDESKITEVEKFFKLKLRELQSLGESSFETIEFEECQSNARINWACSFDGCPNPAVTHCSSCKWRRYCSSKCQAAHWRTHRKECSMTVEDQLKQIRQLPWEHTLPLVQALVYRGVDWHDRILDRPIYRPSAVYYNFIREPTWTFLRQQGKVNSGADSINAWIDASTYAQHCSAFEVLLRRGLNDLSDVQPSMLGILLDGEFVRHHSITPHTLGSIVQTLLERGSNPDGIQQGGCYNGWPEVLLFVKHGYFGRHTTMERSEVVARALIGARRNFESRTKGILGEWLHMPIITSIILPFCVARWFCP